MKHGGLFAFAGLWERWDKGEQPVESYTIIVTAANDLLRPIHGRIPVILDPEQFGAWLDVKATPPEEAEKMLRPYPPKRMTAHPVSTRVNKPLDGTGGGAFLFCWRWRAAGPPPACLLMVVLHVSVEATEACMRLTPKPPKISDTDGFTDDNDLFGYREFGERLAKRVQILDEPVVLLLDGPWGSGKSTFILQWSGLLRQRGVPVIVFDAFANDHQEDAFIALASEIATAAQQIGTRGREFKTFLTQAKKVGHVLLPAAARISLRAATLGALSSDQLENIGQEARALIEGTATDVGLLAEKIIEERLNRAQAERNAISAFRNSLHSLAIGLSARALESKAQPEAVRKESADVEPEGDDEGVKGGPLVFIIDELDRCRPTFALSVLERVKHFFSVDGVCFVLVTHWPHLEAIVSGVYGVDIDARTYLEKFIHLRLSLPSSAQKSTEERSRYVSYLWRTMELDPGDPQLDRLVREGLVSLADAHQLNLRTLEGIATHVALVYAATNDRYMRIPPIIVGLCVMRQISSALYRKARAGGITWDEVKKFMRFGEWKNTSGDWTTEWYEHWWRLGTDDSIGESEAWPRDLMGTLAKYHLRDRKDMVRLTAALIDELHQRSQEG